MNVSKFLPTKDALKKGGKTILEIGVVGGTMLASAKFLDANTLFKDQIAKDPAYVDKWWIKYQAPIKLIGGVGGAVLIKNPWIKLIGIGIALNGFIGSVRLATSMADGTNFFPSIGNAANDLDAQLLAAARTAGAPHTEQYKTSVGTKPTDLMSYEYSNVGERYSQMYRTNVGDSQFMRGPMFQRGIGGTGCASSM